MSPTDFTIIKNKIETSPMLNEQEKKEWLFLLPRMSAEQMKELDRILSIKLPSSIKPAVTPLTSPPSTPTVPSGQVREERVGVIAKPVDLRPKTISAPGPFTQRPTLPPGLESFKSLTVEDLRQAPSIYDFLEKLTLKIEELPKAHAATAAQIMAALEQSPFYKAYVESGLKFMAGEEKADLNHDELEAFTDFRANLRKILK